MKEVVQAVFHTLADSSLMIHGRQPQGQTSRALGASSIPLLLEAVTGVLIHEDSALDPETRRVIFDSQWMALETPILLSSSLLD